MCGILGIWAEKKPGMLAKGLALRVGDRVTQRILAGV